MDTERIEHRRYIDSTAQSQNLRKAGQQMRVQLALNVTNLDEAIAFYSTMFNTQPYKVKPGYANWAIANPPLKLVIFENAAAEPGSINHLGVETETSDEVVEHEARLREAGLTTTGIDDTICCFAEKVETWVSGPEGHRWEWYVKAADHDTQLENLTVERTESSAINSNQQGSNQQGSNQQGSCCMPATASTQTQPITLGVKH